MIDLHGWLNGTSLPDQERQGSWVYIKCTHVSQRQFLVSL